MGKKTKKKPAALDFFAGSGLVTEGLKRHFRLVWANDNCAKKAATYQANFGNVHFDSRGIEDVRGGDLPPACLSWASFPCQDLSLAGGIRGIRRGQRSALYWHWLRVMDEMTDGLRPPLLCVENVVGFLVAHGGSQFKLAYDALRDRGYRAGAFIVDASHFVPQSRARSFIVAIREGLPTADLEAPEPLPGYHAPNVMTAHKATDDPGWIWWKLPPLPSRARDFGELCERDAPVHDAETTNRLLRMLSDRNAEKLEAAMACGGFVAGTGYKRIRTEAGGIKRQRLEVRFDGLAGCLRAPGGGSSRQTVVLVEGNTVKTRLLTIREGARLMGVRDTFKFVGSYNEAYRALGDAVAVPVTRWIAAHLLAPLAQKIGESVGGEL